ncbi:hypothetical protein RD110_05320 [Rhodoferax koreense]|uniref:FecR protein domain-containing protein n=1 Tax=Rhodoferax koreensis TaxID=1842727 RepID=A0A1P8JSD6_9BURK|nr:FecR domain-containing protein [Rhodoferax koreense]APW36684.1 hypothetical protein RD110_05320 [Rhodoferax koreense]
MKITALPLTLALCFATAPLAGLAADASAAPPAAPAEGSATPAKSGTMKQVNGAVSVVDAQGVRRALKPGDAVAVADQVVTGPNGAASLVLRDGTTLMLGPDSQLEIKGFTYDAARQEGNVFLSMLRGTMRMITGLIGKAHPEAVKINTPTSLIGVLGTDFIVQAQGTP